MRRAGGKEEFCIRWDFEQEQVPQDLFRKVMKFRM